MIFYTYDEALNSPVIDEKWIRPIQVGLDKTCRTLAGEILRKTKTNKKNPIIAFDSFPGAEWEDLISGIKKILLQDGVSLRTVNIASTYKKPREIKKIVDGCINKNIDFGVVYKGKIEDFFNIEKLKELKKKIIQSAKKDHNGFPGITIVFGTGAAISFLKDLYDLIVYKDITLDVLFELFEEEKAHPLSSTGNPGISLKYKLKMFTYIDFPVLSRHKKSVLNSTDHYITGDCDPEITLIPRKSYKKIMYEVVRYPIRLQPFYIPRIWGGKYLIKIRRLPLKALSFSMEVYVPLQNIRISLGKNNIKIPFLNILWAQPEKVLGRQTVKKFGIYFPLTANYDDTYKGGSLAIQTHPPGRYMKSYFNEKMRHDETYYIAKAWKGAKTYLGIKEETDLDELRKLCRRSEEQKIEFNQDDYINSFKSKIGDLFLIPSGTVHASGENQLVLELDMDGSRVGAEYTFHLYDFLRPDLEGRLRSIHIDHSFNVIRKFIRTDWARKNLKQKPRLIRKGNDWAEYILGSRREMLYQVNRLEFQKRIEDDTKDRFHILTLVEGDKAVVSSKKFPEKRYELNYTETVVIPAGLGRYSIENLTDSYCKVTKSSLK